MTWVHYLLSINRCSRTTHLFWINNTFWLLVHHILVLLLLKSSFIKLPIFMWLLLLLWSTSICLAPSRTRSLSELILIMHPIVYLIHIHLLNILSHRLLLLWHLLTSLIVSSIRTNIISNWPVNVSLGIALNDVLLTLIVADYLLIWIR